MKKHFILLLMLLTVLGNFAACGQGEQAEGPAPAAVISVEPASATAEKAYLDIAVNRASTDSTLILDLKSNFPDGTELGLVLSNGVKERNLVPLKARRDNYVGEASAVLKNGAAQMAFSCGSYDMFPDGEYILELVIWPDEGTKAMLPDLTWALEDFTIYTNCIGRQYTIHCEKGTYRAVSTEEVTDTALWRPVSLRIG